MGEDHVVLVPRNSPIVRFLSREEQAKYEETVKVKYNSKLARKTLDISRRGSNVFKVIELKNQGIKVAGSPELGLIAERNRDWISDYLIFVPSLVLRSCGDSYIENDFLAKDLAKQLRKNTFENPVVINELENEESTDTPYGLKFKRGQGSFYEASALRHENHRRSFNKFDKRGMPDFADPEADGGRFTLYTRSEGLSGLCICGGEDWGSGWGDLKGSPPDGKILVIDVEKEIYKGN